MINKEIYKNRFFLAAVSGILFGIASNYVLIFPAIIALVPLFIAIQNVNPRQSFLLGLLAGIPFGLISCNWMVSLVRSYTGTETNTGIILTAISALFLGIQLGMFCLIYVWINKIIHLPKHRILTAVITGSSIWIILEWLRFEMIPGIPWLVFCFAHTQSRLGYLIQLSSITGPWGTSFIVAAINILIAFAIMDKKIKYFILAAALFTANFAYGYILVGMYKPPVNSSGVKSVIISENLSAKTRWEKQNSDSLAAIFIRLNLKAAQINPGLIVWSETAVPWIFSLKDNLLNIALSKIKNTNATSLIGILTEAGQPGFVYNSVYSIRHDGRILARYDKNLLLTLLEEPLSGFGNIILPFFHNVGFKDILPGKSTKPIYTTAGKAGILICNESSVPFNARETSDEGAEFLVNMSNDAWFEHTVLVDWHFYAARMRAVENRKDIIINSNRGISAIINSMGEILVEKQSKSPDVLSGIIYPNTKATIYTRFGDWFVYLNILILLTGVFYFKRTKKRKILSD